MSGSHNLKYYAMNYYVSIMQKKQSSITQHYKTIWMIKKWKYCQWNSWDWKHSEWVTNRVRIYRTTRTRSFYDSNRSIITEDFTRNFENLVRLVSGCRGKETTNAPANVSQKCSMSFTNICGKVHQYYEWMYWTPVIEVTNKQPVLHMIQWQNTE